MHPILFKIGPLTFYSYGALLAIAFIVCIYLIKKESKDFGFQPEQMFDFCFCLLVSGILGARIFYSILNFKFFLKNPLEILMIHHGGLVWYGGLIGAFTIGIIYLRIKKLPVLRTIDFISPYIALGQAIGRIGCFMNGCCFGKPSNVCGIYFPVHDAKLIPTQLISSGLLLIIFFVLRRRSQIKHQDGEIFSFYILYYSVARFLVEFLRGDSSPLFAGLTIFQVISILLIAISSYAIIYIRSSGRR